MKLRSAHEWAFAATCVPVALAGYSLSQRRRNRDRHANIDDFFGQFEGDELPQRRA